MPSPITAGMKLKVTFACLMGTQYGLISVKYNVKSVGGLGMTDQKLIDGLSTDWGTLLKAAINDNASYYGAKLDHLAVLAPAPVSSFLSAGAGTGGADALPSQTAGVVRKNTALAGRKGRGRLFLPFPSEQHSTVSGAPSAAYLVATVPIMALLTADHTITSGADSATVRAIVT